MGSFGKLFFDGFPAFCKKYAIYFAPVLCLVFLIAESYQADFRPFYVAARSVVLHLNPYLNPVNEFPELFAAGNANDSPASGFRYPPFAALVFAPLGLITSYEVARIVFSLLMLASFVGVFFWMARRLRFELPSSAVVLALVSFPTLALFERGQIDIFLVLLALAVFLLYEQGGGVARGTAALLLAIAAQIKIFPIFLLVYFLVRQRDWKFCLYTVLFGLGLAALAYGYFGSEVHYSFLQRSLPEVFGPITRDQPISTHGQSIENIYIINAIQGNGKIFAHDFVNGRMNVLFFESSIGAVVFGTVAMVVLLLVSRKRPADAQFFQVMTGLNLVNSLAWIMGLVWYLPLFFYLYGQVGNRGKAVLLIPLFLLPFINLNGYAAYAVALLYGLGKLGSANAKSSDSGLNPLSTL
ncbi:MAG TPA: glycosyltransferase family 87 protein [Trichocoleus sp.]